MTSESSLAGRGCRTATNRWTDSKVLSRTDHDGLLEILDTFLSVQKCNDRNWPINCGVDDDVRTNKAEVREDCGGIISSPRSSEWRWEVFSRSETSLEPIKLFLSSQSNCFYPTNQNVSIQPIKLFLSNQSKCFYPTNQIVSIQPIKQKRTIIKYEIKHWCTTGGSSRPWWWRWW